MIRCDRHVSGSQQVLILRALVFSPSKVVLGVACRDLRTQKEIAHKATAVCNRLVNWAIVHSPTSLHVGGIVLVVGRVISRFLAKHTRAPAARTVLKILELELVRLSKQINGLGDWLTGWCRAFYRRLGRGIACCICRHLFVFRCLYYPATSKGTADARLAVSNLCQRKFFCFCWPYHFRLLDTQWINLRVP